MSEKCFARVMNARKLLCEEHKGISVECTVGVIKQIVEKRFARVATKNILRG
jgi:hypothetical protein